MSDDCLTLVCVCGGVFYPRRTGDARGMRIGGMTLYVCQRCGEILVPEDAVALIARAYDEAVAGGTIEPLEPDFESFLEAALREAVESGGVVSDFLN